MALEELARTTKMSPATAVRQGTRWGDSWIGRHPVLFGAMVGLGVGLIGSAAALEESGNPDVTKGQYVLVYSLLGTGVGAGIGAAVSALR